MPKSKEELLREELRAVADVLMKLLQWGITLMVSLETALFFIRREVLLGEIQSGRLKPGEELQPYRYYMGTAFLCFVAFVMISFTLYNSARYRHYRSQLSQVGDSGITDYVPPRFVRPLIRVLIVLLYVAFPIIDILVRVIIEVKVKL